MIILILSKVGEAVNDPKEFTVALEAKEFIRTAPEGTVFSVSVKADEVAEAVFSEYGSGEVALKILEEKASTGEEKKEEAKTAGDGQGEGSVQ